MVQYNLRSRNAKLNISRKISLDSVLSSHINNILNDIIIKQRFYFIIWIAQVIFIGENNAKHISLVIKSLMHTISEPTC